MFITLLYLLLLFNSGLTVVVLQSGDQMSHPGLTVNFECSMGPGFSMGSYTMLWYRQNQYGALLEFLTKEYDQTAGRFQSSLETSKNNFSLQVTGLLLNDSSTYYCAASHSDAHGPHCHTNNNWGCHRWHTDSCHPQELWLGCCHRNSSSQALIRCTVTQTAEAYFGGGTKLTVLEPDHDITPPTVKVLKPSTKECRKQTDGARKKTIVCVASGFYPDHVTVDWQINGETQTTGVATDNAALREGKTYRITSRLRVPREHWYTLDKNFSCIVNFYNGSASSNYTGTVLGVEGEEKGGMTREDYLKISQTAKLSYGLLIIKSSLYGAFVAFLVWKLQSSAGKRN
ncbi:M1-specific T cell receptor beta chain [Etheostoma spectabile]|uniref:M1-specific T cell receptor beta chain n=1 Tax=Etheostoma spectabile TaxID=54343 RepID=UPI0013AF356B|nr:M1-specific T cell receptor beta chain-like [Etheostoma spectabile]